MITIYKYQIPIKDKFEIEMHRGAVILSVQVQRGIPCLWAMVDKEMSKGMRKFILLGTGHDSGLDSSSRLNYTGTFQLHDETEVYHLFER